VIPLDYDKIDPHFLEDLRKSDEVTCLIARNLRLNGFSVTLPPINVRGHYSQMKDYTDDGDLRIANSIVEVKQRPDLHFSGIQDFPYSDIIVDVTHHYDSMSQKPAYYVICNADLTGAIVVSGKTFGSWTISRRWDNKRGRERTFYLVPTRLCNYWDFREKPKFRFE
jgi:hypothetical protein